MATNSYQLLRRATERPLISSRLLPVLALLAVVLLGAACAQEKPTATPEPPTPTMEAGDQEAGHTEEMVAQGRQLFLSKSCSACHGQDAEGSAIAPPWQAIAPSR